MTNGPVSELVENVWGTLDPRATWQSMQKIGSEW